MMDLYSFIRDSIMIPCYPITRCYAGNLNIAEEILLNVQGRVVLYLMCPETGINVPDLITSMCYYWRLENVVIIEIVW